MTNFAHRTPTKAGDIHIEKGHKVLPFVSPS